MPVNLPPQAQAVYEEYQDAKDIDTKIKKLQEYLSLIPSHKGAENLRERVKKKLAKLRAKREKKKKKKAGKTQLFTVPKKLDVQLPLFGLPKTGKSSLFTMLTGAKPQIGERTRFPRQGALYFQGVGTQVIDLPPVFSADLRETPHGRELMGIARNADLICLIIDLSQSITWQFETLKGSFKDAGIKLQASKPPITFEELSKGGIRLFGMDYVPMERKELVELIEGKGISNCIFEAYGKVSSEDIINTISRSISRKPALVIGTKADAVEISPRLEKLREVTDLPIVVTSSSKERGERALGETVIERLNLMRVWTSDQSKRAVVLKEGATVRDAAEKIHSSFADGLKYARITRKGAKVEKKRVGEEFQLKDGDKVKFILS